MESSPHSRDLRRGRTSAQHRIYHVVATTRERRPVFGDLYAACVLISALRREAENGRAQTLAFVVMPDHLHWLLQLLGGHLSQVVGAMKSVSAHRLRQRVWQPGYYDHALRKEEDVVAVARYIVANPLRVGLVEDLRDYSHWDAIWLE